MEPSTYEAVLRNNFNPLGMLVRPCKPVPSVHADWTGTLLEQNSPCSGAGRRFSSSPWTWDWAASSLVTLACRHKRLHSCQLPYGHGIRLGAPSARPLVQGTAAAPVAHRWQACKHEIVSAHLLFEGCCKAPRSLAKVSQPGTVNCGSPAAHSNACGLPVALHVNGPTLTWT